METSSSKSKLKSPVLGLNLPVDKTLVSKFSMQNRIFSSSDPSPPAPKPINLAQNSTRNEIYSSGSTLPGWLKTGKRTTHAKALPDKGSSFPRDGADEISQSTIQHHSESHTPLKKRKSNAIHNEAESSMHPLIITEKIDVHMIHTKSPKQYMCNICDKTFNSYQALGGHKVHHKIKVYGKEQQPEGICSSLHECTFCDKVFSTGQALGGHKRHCREPAPESVSSHAESRETMNRNTISRFDLNELPEE